MMHLAVAFFACIEAYWASRQDHNYNAFLIAIILLFHDPIPDLS